MLLLGALGALRRRQVVVAQRKRQRLREQEARRRAAARALRARTYSADRVQTPYPSGARYGSGAPASSEVRMPRASGMQ